MGATFPFRCPVEGCEYVAHFRLGMGDEYEQSAHFERLDILRKEHPDHPKQ